MPSGKNGVRYGPQPKLRRRHSPPPLTFHNRTNARGDLLAAVHCHAAALALAWVLPVAHSVADEPSRVADSADGFRSSVGPADDSDLAGRSCAYPADGSDWAGRSYACPVDDSDSDDRSYACPVADSDSDGRSGACPAADSGSDDRSCACPAGDSGSAGHSSGCDCHSDDTLDDSRCRDSPLDDRSSGWEPADCHSFADCSRPDYWQQVRRAPED